MPAAVIFDLDGTLVTFHFDMSEWRKILLAELDSRGFKTEGLDLATPTQAILDAAAGQTPKESPEVFAALRRDAYAILDDLETRAALSAAPYPGTVEVLKKLRGAGVRLAVLTNSGKKAATSSLERAKFLEFFEFVLTRDDIGSMKPKPEGLQKATRMLKLPPSEVLYVGDTPMDVAAARDAGVRVVSVATGNYTAGRLKAEGADFVISELGELPGVLGV